MRPLTRRRGEPIYLADETFYGRPKARSISYLAGYAYCRVYYHYFKRIHANLVGWVNLMIQPEISGFVVDLNIGLDFAMGEINDL